MSIKSQILKTQLDWAKTQGLTFDERGYLSSYEENLYQPLNQKTKVEFDLGSGSELKDSLRSPAKMRALHSSSALAVNFFDTWVTTDITPLINVLDLDVEDMSIRFEGQYPTGLPGNPPNLDVILESSNGLLVGVESKFTEWLSPKSRNKLPFKDKYFPQGVGVWEKVGLVQTQKLADKMQNQSLFFRYLDAAQLMKHALGLATHHRDKFRLLYIYFDDEGTEGAEHKNEITIFSNHLKGELGFCAYTYQHLILALQKNSEVSDTYIDYLSARYL